MTGPRKHNLPYFTTNTHKNLDYSCVAATQAWVAHLALTRPMAIII